MVNNRIVSFKEIYKRVCILRVLAFLQRRVCVDYDCLMSLFGLWLWHWRFPISSCASWEERLGVGDHGGSRKTKATPLEVPMQMETELHIAAL